MNKNELDKNYPNLSKEECRALQYLMKDKNIILKSTDKGSAIVIWDRDDYLKECKQQLSDKKVYKKCNDFQQ